VTHRDKRILLFSCIISECW